MPTSRELLKKVKAEIQEVDGAEAQARLDDSLVLDVREPDEYEQGAIPGALHIPRGHLEGQVEGKVPDHSTPIIVHCASGFRSAFAAKTLQDLGYENVVNLAGGFNKWKDEGRPWKVPQTLTAEQRNRYQRHLLLPEVDVAGEQ